MFAPIAQNEWESIVVPGKFLELNKFFEFIKGYIFKLQTLKSEHSVDSKRRATDTSNAQLNKFKKNNKGGRT